MNFFTGILFGRNGGLTHRELEKMTFRNKFSEYLPYVAYDEETEVYLNTDQTAGFIWECTPLVYASPAIFDTLRGLFSASLPVKSVLQFMLYADPYIKPVMDAYRLLRTRDMDVVKSATDGVYNFMMDGARKGVKNFQGIPIRNFRLFVSLKIPMEKDIDVNDIRDTIYEILKGAYLFPRSVTPEHLIDFLMRLFNDNPPEKVTYNDTIPISKQIILSETPIRAKWDRMEIGSKYFKCLTPKSMPT